MLFEWIRSRKEEVLAQQVYFKEVFSGIKPRWISRSFLFLNFSRRAILIIVGIFSSGSMLIDVILFFLVQLVYFVLVVLLRPFANTRDNIIEITNECFFTIFAASVLYLNEEDRWSKVFETVFLGIMVINSFIVLGIVTVALLVHFKKHGFKCKSSSKTRVQNYRVESPVSLKYHHASHRKDQQ